MSTTNGNGNGHDATSAETLDLLRQILGRVADVDAKVNRIDGKLDEFRVEVRGELTDMRAEIRELHHSVADTNVRITHLGDDLRAQLRDHEQRLAKLEEAVFKKTA